MNIDTQDSVPAIDGKLSYAYSDDYRNIPRELIEHLAPDLRFILSTTFTAALQDALKTVEFKYVIARSGNVPVGLVFLCMCQSGPFRTAMCGHPLLCVDCGISTPAFTLADEFRERIVLDLPTIAKHYKAQLLIVKDTLIGPSTWQSSGYFPVPNEPALHIPNMSRWSSFEDYLSNMNNKYRKKIQSARNKTEQHNVVMNFDASVSDAERIHALYLNVANRLPQNPSTGVHWLTRYISNFPRRYKMRELTVEFFQDVVPAFPDNIDMVTLESDGVVEANAINVTDNNTYYSLFVGQGALLPFPVCYRALLSAKIEKAFLNNVDRVVFGRTAATTKIEFGASPFAVTWWAKFLSPTTALANVPFAWATRKIPETELPVRNVFKDAVRSR